MGISGLVYFGYGAQWVRLVFFVLVDAWGRRPRLSLLNPWWHGGQGGLVELGESVLKAGGIEIWSLGNATPFCRSHPRLVPMNAQSGILCDPASLVLYGRCQASSRPHARSRKGESRRTLRSEERRVGKECRSR